MRLARAGGVVGLVGIGIGSAAFPAIGQSLPDPSPSDRPLWEIGVLGGGGWLPDYPASSENHTRALGLPYAVYRGEIFRVGDGGAARGVVFQDRRLELDIGIDGAFPVDSDDNEAREGMDNLDFLLELGPKLRYRLLPEPDGHELDLSLAVRGVVSTDFSNWRYQGVTVTPAVTYRHRPAWLKQVRLVGSINPLFGYGGLNDYFYRVSPGDAREGREAFEADDGYIGTELSLGLSWAPLDRIRVFGGVQVGYWGGAENEDSPLHEEDLTVSVGGGIRWSIFQSERRVNRQQPGELE